MMTMMMLLTYYWTRVDIVSALRVGNTWLSPRAFRDGMLQSKACQMPTYFPNAFHWALPEKLRDQQQVKMMAVTRQTPCMVYLLLGRNLM